MIVNSYAITDYIAKKMDTFFIIQECFSVLTDLQIFNAENSSYSGVLYEQAPG